MFTGDYGFFAYKYDIPGYSGQDYGGPAQYVYLAVSLVLLIALLTALRKTDRRTVSRIIGGLGVFLTLFYLAKTCWESCYDIRRSGAFNTGLLPFDTCSLIMPACLLAGFGKGRARELAEGWIATGGIVGGVATMMFLHAFKYYPFLSFGAFYSMLWHFLMVFSGLLLIVTDPARLPFSAVRDGYLFHVLASVLVIPIDFIFGFDFMLYRELGGIPFFEGLAARLTAKGFAFLNPLLMLALYFGAFCIIYLAAGIGRRKHIPSAAPGHA